MEILEYLPRTRGAAEEIIECLSGIDSLNAWLTLLSEYEEVLTKEEYILKIELDEEKGSE